MVAQDTQMELLHRIPREDLVAVEDVFTTLHLQELLEELALVMERLEEEHLTPMVVPRLDLELEAAEVVLTQDRLVELEDQEKEEMV